MKKRVIVRVRPGAGRWVLTAPGYRAIFEVKYLAVALGRAMARAKWRALIPAQLVIHKRNGRIQTEHTYGNDPRRSKG